MSAIGMKELVAAMVAAGGPACTDARDHQPVHRALAWLARQGNLSGAFPDFELSPDPEVGTRVRGVTQALWALVGEGFFLVEDRPGRATFRLDPDRLPDARRVLMRLTVDDRTAVDHAAAIWTAASCTSRKKLRSAAASSGTRRVRDANPRHSSAPGLRHAAVSLISPA